MLVAQLNAELLKVLALPEIKERLEREGAELIAGSPKKLEAVIEGICGRSGS